MKKLFSGRTLVGPGDIVVKLLRRIEGESGARWVVEDARSAGTDDIPESELLDDGLWR